MSLYGTLRGCTGIINCVDIDSKVFLLNILCHIQETHALTASSDRSCRIWNIEKCCLIDCLMGHEDKVTVAKFSPLDSSKVLSGGRDRNIKQWDIVSLSCIKSHYIPSSCIDMVPISSNS